MYTTSRSSKEYQKFTELSSPMTATPTPPPAAAGVPVSSSYYSSSFESSILRSDPVPAKPKIPWSSGLFGCFSDVRNCCVTCWCPCITFGRIAEIVDKGSSSCGQSGALYTVITCVTGCPCFYSCFYRSKIRQQYVLHESPCNDCLVHCFCEPCALCQEYRELKQHGFDMKIGWHGNVERQNRGVIMAPAVPSGMSRKG